jgi:hypothetical protein
VEVRLEALFLTAGHACGQQAVDQAWGERLLIAREQTALSAGADD